MTNEEIIKEFRDEIYGENDALFDRSGNNVSRQVEQFLLHALQTQREKLIKNFEAIKAMDRKMLSIDDILKIIEEV